jgi:hypothetical protein
VELRRLFGGPNPFSPTKFRYELQVPAYALYPEDAERGAAAAPVYELVGDVLLTVATEGAALEAKGGLQALRAARGMEELRLVTRMSEVPKGVTFQLRSTERFVEVIDFEGRVVQRIPHVAGGSDGVAPKRFQQQLLPGMEDLAASSTGRGNQMPLARSAEEVVSQHTGIPRNPQGRGQQTIPASGPERFHVPDVLPKGPTGSVRLRGTVIEVKASNVPGKAFGEMSARDRREIRDAVAFIEKVRERAKHVPDPQLRQLLENAKVEVFTDFRAPQSGPFADWIKQKLIAWEPIPR